MAEEEIGARLRLKDRKQFSDDANRASDDIKDIGKAADKADRSGRKMGSGMGVLKTAIGGVTKVAKAGALAIGALGAAAVAAGVKFISMAMDAAESASAFNTVFGPAADEVQKFVDTVNQDFGIPTAELQDASRQFGVFAKAAGLPQDDLAEFSTALTQAGLDMASFYNADPTDVFQALQSGLSGETEPLRRFGIFMSDASLNAFALSEGIGKTTKEMTDQEKVALRQQFIMANLGDAQGDLARTSDGLANQWRGLKGRLEEAGTAIGTALLPYANQLVTALNEEMRPAVSWIQDELPGIVERGASAVEDAFGRMKKAQEDGLNYGQTVEAVTGIEGLEDPVNRLADFFGDLWKILDEGIIPAFQSVADKVPNVLQPLTELDDIVNWLADHTEGLRQVLTILITVFVAWKLATLASNVVLAAQNAILFITQGRLKAMILQSSIIRAATIAWTAVQWLLNAAMTANPIGLVVLAIVGLVAIFVLAWQHSETFRNIVTGAFNVVWGVIQGVWNWISSNWPLLLAIITGPFGMAVYLISTHWETIKEGVTAVKDWITDKFDDVIDFFKKLPGRISRATSGMWNGIKNAFKSAVNWIIRKWNGLQFTLPEIDTHIPGIGKIGGFTLGTPDIPELHKGGTTVTGGAVNMKPGEEIVFLPPAASVVPMTDNVRSMAAGATGRGTEPIVLQVVLDRKVLAEAVYDDAGDRVARS